MAMQYMSSSSSVLDAVDTAFASFDLNNDGGISREELRAVFRSKFRMNKYINVFKRQVRSSRSQAVFERALTSC